MKLGFLVTSTMFLTALTALAIKKYSECDSEKKAKIKQTAATFGRDILDDVIVFTSLVEQDIKNACDALCGKETEKTGHTIRDFAHYYKEVVGGELDEDLNQLIAKFNEPVAGSDIDPETIDWDSLDDSSDSDNDCVLLGDEDNDDSGVNDEYNDGEDGDVEWETLDPGIEGDSSSENDVIDYSDGESEASPLNNSNNMVP